MMLCSGNYMCHKYVLMKSYLIFYLFIEPYIYTKTILFLISDLNIYAVYRYLNNIWLPMRG